MKTVTATTTLYTFNELKDDARNNALTKLWDYLVDHEWHEHTIEEFKTTIAPLLGVTCTNVYFSGFASQGDGACFEGTFEYAKGMVANVKAHTPDDMELIEIAESIVAVQSKAFYRLHGSVSHKGRYSHSGCTDFTVYNHEDDATQDQEDSIEKCYTVLMDWLYYQLEREYTYLTSEEALTEYFLDSDLEFTEDGINTN
jgi:hypothetical protein